MSSLFFPGVSTLTHVTTTTNQVDPAWFAEEEAETHVRFKDGYSCKECGDDACLRFEKDEIVCTRCGTKDDPPIDSSAEYRYFGCDDRGADPTRVGHPEHPHFPESTRGTRILCHPGADKAMRRIAKQHGWNIMPYKERTRWDVFEKLDVRTAAVGISKAITEETKQLYVQVSPLCVCRGEYKDALMAACLFESLKRHGTPWRPSEVAAIFHLDVKLMTRGFKQFSGLLDEHMYATDAKHAPVEEEPETHTTGFEHYLENAMSRLLVPKAKHGAVATFTTTMGKHIDFLGICSEMTPSSLLGTALLLACEQHALEKTVADVAGVCKISTATLQKCMKKIAPWRPVLLKGSQGIEK